jgi:hypothetical protein
MDFPMSIMIEKVPAKGPQSKDTCLQWNGQGIMSCHEEEDIDSLEAFGSKMASVF